MLFLIRLLLVVMLGGTAYRMYVRHERATAAAGADATPGGTTFAAVLMPDGTQRNTVYIYAALNCPHEAAQRADALAASLTRLGIPNVRGNSVSFSFTSPPPQDKADALKRLMEGEIPAVYINGYGKANPTADEVAQVYRSSSQ